jgi:hypothetical protein
MGEGLMFAALMIRLGKKGAARYGTKRVTICAVGRKDGARFVMATDAHGGVILGEPSDFTIPEPRKRKAKASA